MWRAHARRAGAQTRTAAPSAAQTVTMMVATSMPSTSRPHSREMTMPAVGEAAQIRDGLASTRVARSGNSAWSAPTVARRASEAPRAAPKQVSTTAAVGVHAAVMPWQLMPLMFNFWRNDTEDLLALVSPTGRTGGIFLPTIGGGCASSSSHSAQGAGPSPAAGMVAPLPQIRKPMVPAASEDAALRHEPERTHVACVDRAWMRAVVRDASGAPRAAPRHAIARAINEPMIVMGPSSGLGGTLQRQRRQNFPHVSHVRVQNGWSQRQYQSED